MLDLQHLRTFVVLASTKNFTRAAMQLGLSQPSVTVHIKALEKELGASLFERFRFARTIVLTDMGRRVYDYATRLLTLAEETRTVAQRKPKATLTDVASVSGVKS